MTDKVVLDLSGLCSPRDLADYYHVSLGIVQEAVKEGAIPGSIRVLGRLYFDKETALAGWVPTSRNLKGKKDALTSWEETRQKSERPKRITEDRYLKTLSAAVTFDDWMAIIDRAVGQAKEGEWRARSWLSSYLMGTPVKRVEADVEITDHSGFSISDRAAAVLTLLEEAREREKSDIIDVVPSEE